jgi:uncharacterized protein (TIGR02757 family)
VRPPSELKSPTRMSRLKDALDSIEVSTPLNDPIEHVRHLGSAEDKEVGGFMVAAITYGKIDRIMADTQYLLATMGNRPAQFVMNFNASSISAFRDFTHRFTRGTHVACLVVRLKRALRDYGSLHALFREAWSRPPDMRTAISDFVDILRRYDCPGFCNDCTTPRRQSVRWLLSKPSAGSAAKRMCLYLRWMVRDTPPDIGAWKDVPKSTLVIPLDTHVARIGRLLGLTQRTSSGWLTAVEITRELKRLDPDDPLRYDYPLSHLGIDGKCSGSFSVATCASCALRELCAVGTPKPSRLPTNRTA